ncbi:MAG: ABC transporter ATP-binding protein [Phycisphaeraceae bacterium]
MPPRPSLTIGSTGDEAASNVQLVRRLLGLAWQYRRSVITLVSLQMLMLVMTMAGLGFTGLAIDVIGYSKFGGESDSQTTIDTETGTAAARADTGNAPDAGSGGETASSRSTTATSPAAADADAAPREPADAEAGGTRGVKPPSYPLGLDPPETWPPMSRLSVIASAILLVGLLRFVLDRNARIAQAKLVENLVVNLRAQVYDKLQRLSFRFFDANASGSLINRVAGDVQRTRMFVDSVLVPVLVMVVSLIVFTSYMLSINVMLTVACLITTPFLWLLTGYFSKLVKPAYRENRKLMDKAVEVLAETVSGVRVIKGFSRQKREIDKFTTANANVKNQQQWIFNKVSLFTPLIGVGTYLNIFIMLVFGGWLYLRDPELSLGDLLVFSGLLQQFSSQIGNIAQLANNIQASLIGAARVFEVLDTPVEITSPENPAELGQARGEVRFDHVSFSYTGHEKALQDIDFQVNPGQCVAILGPTGAGKSTLMSLIPRFYDPDEGRILLDGRDVREYDLDELRRNIGMVFQESFLFSNTVAANIAFGHPDASEEQITNAARIAQAHDFIMRDLSKGYDTLLTESGANLSGGQRQRLALARAILLEPPILLMDDPTAAIDPETEHEILEAMDHAMKGRTTFVVAHRLSTLRRADLVIVLDRGRIVESGTHEELMIHGGHYRHAADIQLADDEDKRLLNVAG